MFTYLGAKRLKEDDYIDGNDGGANTTVRGLGFYFGIGNIAAAGRASAPLGIGAT